MVNGEEILVSALGVRFTRRTTWTMQTFWNSVRFEGAKTINYSVALDADGALQVGLGADYAAQANSIRDQVGNVEFWWYALPEHLELLKEFIVDTVEGAGTRLIR